jgi:hypothetical protein
LGGDVAESDEEERAMAEIRVEKERAGGPRWLWILLVLLLLAAAAWWLVSERGTETIPGDTAPADTAAPATGAAPTDATVPRAA